MAIQIINGNKRPRKAISGLDCKIGGTYRRLSEPDKLYFCTRDTSRDSGNMLVSLAHGNRMTANMHAIDFILVNSVITYVDAE